MNTHAGIKIGESNNDQFGTGINSEHKDGKSLFSRMDYN
jgi:hypothetical protein